MNYQDLQNGRYGGPASDTADYKTGRTQRHVQEMNETLSQIMAPPTVTPGAAGSQYFGHPGGVTGKIEPEMSDAWDACPPLAFITFLVLVALSLAFVWPALNAIGALPVPFVRVVLLGAPCLFLSTWTKALPFISAGGILLLLAYGMLSG